MRWKFSVGNEILDEQHKQIFRQLKVLKSWKVAQNDNDMLKEYLRFLSKYAAEHLHYEEEYMKKLDYPELKKHQSLHLKFIENMKEIKKKVGKHKDKDLIKEAEQFLEEWWTNHILKEDMKYARFIENKYGDDL